MITSRKQLPFALLALLLGCSADVGERAAEINGGATPSKTPAGASVILRASNGTGFCSGVLLPAGDRVLTAAHCLDRFWLDHFASELPARFGELPFKVALSVRDVAVVGQTTVVGGTVVREAAGPQAFFMTQPAGAAYRSDYAGGSGINAVTLGSTGVVGVGWSGGRDGRQVSLFSPIPGTDAIDILPLEDIGAGVATAVLSYGAGPTAGLIVAGYVPDGGVENAFVAQYDRYNVLVSMRLQPGSTLASKLRIADLALAADGTILVAGTQVGPTKRAQLLSLPPTGDASAITLATGNDAGLASRAVAAEAGQSAVVLVGDGNHSRVYRIDGTGPRVLHTFSLANHYLLHSGGTDKYLGFRARDLVRDSSGRLVVVGKLISTSSAVPVMARLTADGQPDEAFGTHGVLILPTEHGGKPFNGSANAVAISSQDVLHVAVRRTSADLHLLGVSRYAADRASSATGSPTVNGSALSKIVVHEKHDLAIATLSTPQSPVSYSFRSTANQVGEDLYCVGMGPTSVTVATGSPDAGVAPAGLTEGLFRTSQLTLTAAGIVGHPGVQMAKGDSGGGCFAVTTGALAGVMISSHPATGALAPLGTEGVIVRGDIVDAFITTNSSNP